MPSTLAFDKDTAIEFRPWAAGVDYLAQRPLMQKCAHACSTFLEERIAPRTMVHLLHLQLALLVTLLPLVWPVWCHIAMVLWVLVAGRIAWRSWKSQDSTHKNSSPSRI
ncbi:MAG: hypothetical protein Q4D66_03710 [Bacteroidales bacterium]|nr:hypothetical protein [Bacteroidales bacterium]